MRKTINTDEKTLAELIKIQAEIMSEEGKQLSLNDVLRHLIAERAGQASRQAERVKLKPRSDY
jgi:hypothetical protein